MIWPVLISGFLLGAAGSLHCVGMCGPLSLALPTLHLSPFQKFYSLLFYQFGRVVTYSVIGFTFGIAGRSIYLAGYQQWFSIISGIFILALALPYFATGKSSRPLHFLTKFYAGVQQLIHRILKSAHSKFSFLLLGMANGLLPCGMIYIALAATLSFTTLWQSVSFMAMFGLGTMPAMMALALLGQSIKPQTRVLLKKAIPYFITCIGLLLVLRGLNLGIPFLSPSLPKAVGTAIICH
jgi:uncharacterized protein